jgi:predicted anti-sigma-YlaC factor YlaD
MRCRDAEELLPQYADDMLAGGQREALSRHLAGCEACRRELEFLNRALASLSSAARPPAPDLWESFQARLAAQVPQMACDRVEALLPAYREAAEELPQRPAISAHLAACASCAAEEALLARSQAVLDQASAGRFPQPETPPDLWPVVSEKLAAEIPCGKVQDLLPAYLDRALQGAPSIQVEQHLAHCAPCAAATEDYRLAVGALERAAAAPAADLWPAMAARLAREPSRQPLRKRWALAGLAGALRGALRSPGWQPALGLAAAVVVALAARTVLHVPQRVRSVPGEAQARTRPVTPEVRAARGEDPLASKGSPAIIPGKAETAAETPKARSVRLRTAPRLARSVPVRWNRRVRLRGETPRRSLVASRPAPVRVEGAPEPFKTGAGPASHEREHGLVEVAQGSPAEINSPDARTRVMPEVVEAVRLLAGVEDAASGPFEAGSDGQ